MSRAVVIAVVALLVGAVAAWADETITARAPNQFAAGTTTIDQGEKVTLMNLDVAGHDVTSKKRTESGQPIFRSELIPPGESGPVEGTEYLVTGTYPFVCSVHPGMEATLEVTSAGTPAKKPDPPKVSVKITSGDLQRVVKKGKLNVRVTSTKAAVKLTARDKAGKLGGATADFGSAGTKTVAVRLSKKARKRLGGRSSAKVTVTAVATDTAGQTGKATAARTLR